MNLSEWIPEGLRVDQLLVHLALSLILGQVLSWHYVRFAQVLSNKRRFARIFPFIATTTFLMITVVKTSLALSLGLVGALSIIRFRTPIKEPEELAYLFLAIAVGVGLGANQPFATLLIYVTVLGFLAIRASRSGSEPPVRTVVQVSAPVAATEDASSAALKTLLPAVEGSCSRVDLRRVDAEGEQFHASLVVELGGPDRVADLLSQVQRALPGATVSVIEREGLE